MAVHENQTEYLSPYFKPISKLKFKMKRSSIVVLIAIFFVMAYFIHVNTFSSVSCDFFNKYNPPTPSPSPLSIQTSFLNESESKNESDSRLQKAKLLNDVWTRLYALNESTSENVQIKSLTDFWAVPPAPHLQNCPLVTENMQKMEHYDSKVGYPSWAIDSNFYGVKPPWIKGGDEENLPLTRLTQRDIWLNQNPLNCSDKNLKFVLVNWIPTKWHGLGSQLHVMSFFFAIALASDRVFVPYPSSFGRSNNRNCKRMHRGSFDCYFFPIVSQACEKEAMRLHRNKQSKVITVNAQEENSSRTLDKIFNSEERVLFFEEDVRKLFYFLEYYPDRINFPKYKVMSSLRVVKANRSWRTEPWKKSHKIAQIQYKNSKISNTTKFRIWMMSQIIRFMLRWPSLHVCHVVNQERHRVYGSLVIDQMAEAEERQQNNALRGRMSKKEKERLKELGGFKASKWADSDMEDSHVLNFPFLFRPILSLHVRQGDKSIETKLFPLSVFMHFAEQMRFRVPGLKYVWLSTESESVIRQLEDYPSWTFLYSHMPRLNGSTPIHKYESQIGTGKFMDLSLVNLIVASECDYFVGTLSSNWNLLINELRLTNGNVNSDYISFDIWDKLL